MGECANISITRAPRRRCEQRSSFPASNSDHHCHESGNSFPAVILNCRKHIPAAQAGRGNAWRQIFASGASKRKFEDGGKGDAGSPLVHFMLDYMTRFRSLIVAMYGCDVLTHL